MIPERVVFALVSRLRDFARNNDGLAALEFALLLPVMVLLYVGGVEVDNGVAISYKTTLTARTVADLATQYLSIDNSTMTSILNASSQVIAPYSSSNIVVTVSEVSVDANGNATIIWSDSLNGTARNVGQPVTLPAQVNTPNNSLIWGEVTYSYTPSLGVVLTGTYKIYENVFLYPRLSSSVTRVNS